MSPAFPLAVTKSELEEYNEFWASLSPEDRAELQKMIENAHMQLIAATHYPGYYRFRGIIPALPEGFITFLLCLLMEVHKERLRLKIELSRLRPIEDDPAL